MLSQCLHTFTLGQIPSLRIDGLYFDPDVCFLLARDQITHLASYCVPNKVAVLRYSTLFTQCSLSTGVSPFRC